LRLGRNRTSGGSAHEFYFYFLLHYYLGKRPRELFSFISFFSGTVLLLGREKAGSVRTAKSQIPNPDARQRKADDVPALTLSGRQ
jgi:hypothetical protein